MEHTRGPDSDTLEWTHTPSHTEGRRHHTNLLQPALSAFLLVSDYLCVYKALNQHPRRDTPRERNISLTSDNHHGQLSCSYKVI